MRSQASQEGRIRVEKLLVSMDDMKNSKLPLDIKLGQHQEPTSVKDSPDELNKSFDRDGAKR